MVEFSGRRTARTAVTAEPFAFAPSSAMIEGAKAMSLMWSIPFRAMMVVMSEAARKDRAD